MLLEQLAEGRQRHVHLVGAVAGKGEEEEGEVEEEEEGEEGEEEEGVTFMIK